MTASLQNALNMARLELLDMGLRGNTLLNLRYSALTIPVVQEQASEIYRLLVLEQRSLRFLAAPDVSQTLHDQPEDSATFRLDAELPVVVETAADQKSLADTYLQTRLSAQALDQRLVKVSHAARSYYEEQGVEILYLALGCLLWADDAGEARRRAPLVLVPVELQRTGAAEGFKLAYTGADLGANLTLTAKLKSEFNIQLPEFADEGFLYTDYIEAIRNAISSHANWQVLNDEICLGFFSFGKFQMYQDLDPAQLLSHGALDQHTVLADLFAGRLGAAASASADTDVSDIGATPLGARPHRQTDPGLTELNFVKDSDTSQTQAVLDVVSGANLVIQGPPGTGKSQTITNIIAELIGRGRRVLFVAEKMAALEVVKRRLDESHLGEAVLELHSHKSQRKAVIEELTRCLDVGVPQTPDRSQALARHQQLQQQLDAYADAIAQPILNSGIGYVQALAQQLQLTHDDPTLMQQPVLEFAVLQTWSAEDFEQALHQVDELVAHLQNHGSPHLSVWGESALQQFSPTQQQALQVQLKQTDNDLQQCQQALSALLQVFPATQGVVLNEPQTLEQCGVLQASVAAVLRAPTATQVQGVDWQHLAWTSGALAQWWDLLQQMQELRAQRSEQLIDQAWQANVLSIRTAWISKADKWWRLASGDFRGARRELQGLLKKELPEDATQCLAIVDDILRWQSLSEQVQQQSSLAAQVFGEAWQGRNTDWRLLEPIVRWGQSIHTEMQQGKLLHQTFDWAAQWSDAQRQSLVARLQTLDQMSQRLRDDLQHVSELAQLEPVFWQHCEVEESARGERVGGLSGGLVGLQSVLEKAQSSLDDLYAVARFNQLESLAPSTAMRELTIRARRWPHRDASLLRRILQSSWYAGLVQHAYANNPILLQFDRAAHERAIAEFSALDKALFVYAQERLVKQLHARLPAATSVGEMAVLRREMNKKRRHMPLRQLMREAGRVIQQIKPVFMMSPMSIATYLEHGTVDFDVVIFDEASQVRVADALGALLRAKQAVVVGDSRQMPPTDFFSRSLELDDAQAQASQTADIESILGMFVSQGAAQKMLRWHYRSRHDSLIAVSNQAFYEGRLWIFPTPGVQAKATGLRLHHLPDARYDRGQTRSNPLEARAVAQAVMQHAQHTPELSLGVVAFSTAQRDCLLMEIERLRREQPECEDFFNQRRSDGENFFVKNLENVQGDERDVIFISIGYGRTEDGKLVPSFGPINHEGGERRLNVLITRAKLAMDVFCNFTADEMRIDATTPFGVRALQSFLTYAQTRQFPGLVNAQATHPPGVFEQYLCQEIAQLGYQAQARMGQSGFYIDVAVHDPVVNTRYALALQTDGASYQHSADVRERDRVKSGVLTSFGWTLQPTWSIDWFRTPAQERERLRLAIQEALQKLQNPAIAKAEPARSEPVVLNDSQVGLDTVRDQQMHGGQAHHVLEPSLETVTDAAQGAHAVATAETTLVDVSDASIERIDALTAVMNAVPSYDIYDGDLGLPRHQQLHEALPELLSASIRRLVKHEGPMHQDLIERRLAQAASVTRLTAKVQQQIELGVAYGIEKGTLFRTQGFVHGDAHPIVTPRTRANLPTLYRNIEYVSPFELRAALRQAITNSVGIQAQEAVEVALKMLGFARATAKSKAVVESELTKMQRDREVSIHQGKLQSLI